MADIPLPQFEKGPYEQDLKKAESGFLRAKESPDAQSTGDQEKIKNVLTQISGAAASAPSSASGAGAPIMTSADKLEVQHLMNVALREGIVKAATEAAQSSPFIADAFHDELARHVHEEFKKRGLAH